MQIRCHIFNLFLKYKIFTSVCTILVVIIFLQILPRLFTLSKNNCLQDEAIDVVYTWVNGSDTNFLRKLHSYFEDDDVHKREFSSQRFDDKYELKFSLRSLEKYAPWIRHVYIVTNGQIPYWLNLDYEKVTLVTHEEIFQDSYDLPSFSSPAIEVHLHRIPGLSKRFIYFNDDIFLGAPLYIDDFYSESRGFLIYLAWPLPMCATDCPWIYVSDGQCDSACYNADCQMDGGDCDSKEKVVNRGHENIIDRVFDYDNLEGDYEHESNLNFIQRKILQLKSSQNIEDDMRITNSIQKGIVKGLNLTKQMRDTNVLNYFIGKSNISTVYNRNTVKYSENLPLSIFGGGGNGSTNIFNQPNVINLKLNTSAVNITSLVATHNKRVMSLDKLRRKRKFKNHKNGSRSQFKSILSDGNMTLLTKVRSSGNPAEAYGLSLQHSNRIFNLKYGFTPRYVPAHTAIMIDKEVMEALQQTFFKEFKVTSRNRLRNGDDMQYSFSYYYFLMNEKIYLNIGEVFDIFDTDESGTWSDREIRTLLSKLYDLPLSYMILDHFEYILTNCSKNSHFSDVSTPEYERYIDSKLPTISKELVSNCPVLKEALLEHFGHKYKYKHEVLKNTQTKYVTFKMLTSNISEVVGHLDEIRRRPSRFVCLNDNLDYEKTEENELVRAILYDFYLSLFPHPSKFELPQEYRNRFLYKSELDQWKSYHFKLKMCIYFFVLILFYFTGVHICKKRFFCWFFNKIFC